jgi:hypothetical protein
MAPQRGWPDRDHYEQGLPACTGDVAALSQINWMLPAGPLGSWRRGGWSVVLNVHCVLRSAMQKAKPGWRQGAKQHNHCRGSRNPKRATLPSSPQDRLPPLSSLEMAGSQGTPLGEPRPVDAEKENVTADASTTFQPAGPASAGGRKAAAPAPQMLPARRWRAALAAAGNRSAVDGPLRLHLRQC